MNLEETLQEISVSRDVTKKEIYGPSPFERALAVLKEGHHIARKEWLDSGKCIFLIKGRTVEYNTFQSWKNNANKAFDPPADVVIKDHIDMRDECGRYITGWSPSQEDILAVDWYLVQ